MQYTIETPSGIRLTLCAPGVAVNAYTVEADQSLRKYGHQLGPLAFSGNRPLTDDEVKRRQTQKSRLRKQRVALASSAEEQPNSE